MSTSGGNGHDVEVELPGDGTPRAVVVAGGVPSPAQAAAVAAVLQMTARGPTSDDHPGTVIGSGWLRAARQEAVGGPRVRRRADLDRPGHR